MTDVHLPGNLKELWAVFADNPEAAVYAGGTDLFVKLRAAESKPDCLVCLERIQELKGIQRNADEVRIGSATTHAELLENNIISEHFAVLRHAVSVLGSPPIRNMGTIGGNIVTASPAGDTLPPLHVLDAEIEVLSTDGSRLVPICQFILGPGKVDLGTGEIVSAVRLKIPKRQVHHFEKIGKRKALACAVASMAALIDLDENGIIREIRLAWGSLGPKIVTIPPLEEFLKGAELTEQTLKSATHLIEEAVSPISDVRASAEYRRHISGGLLLRTARYSPSFGRK